jgi:hypothetical protein
LIHFSVVAAALLVVDILIQQELSFSKKFRHKSGTSQWADPQHERITVPEIAARHLSDTNCPLGFRTVEA